jgi:O-acetyl-ADP-ribose deacetylase (regulator of RNase III)
MKQAPIPMGTAVFTNAGSLKCQFVIHAPTMEAPVQRTSAEKISRAVRAALLMAKEYEIQSLAMPGMGTGCGRVPPEEAAAAMIDALREFQPSSSNLKRVIFVDLKRAMVQAWENAWHGEFYSGAIE